MSQKNNVDSSVVGNEVDFKEKYRLDYSSMLAQGCFGSVFPCKEISTNSNYAAKIIFIKNYISLGGNLTEKLIQEIELLGSEKIQAHWGLLGAIAAYQCDKTYIVVMELCDMSLDVSALRDILLEAQAPVSGRLGLAEGNARYIMWQVLMAVHYLHSLKPIIIHRDLKPQNILVKDKKCDPYRVRTLVADFGVARTLHELSVAQSVMGSDFYMAPEVCIKQGHDSMADMWSLGGVLYTMLSGEDFNQCLSHTDKPFQRPEDVVLNISSGWSDVSSDAKKLLKGLLRRNPGDRLSAKQALSHRWFQPEVSTLLHHFPPVAPQLDPTQSARMLLPFGRLRRQYNRHFKERHADVEIKPAVSAPLLQSKTRPGATLFPPDPPKERVKQSLSGPLQVDEEPNRHLSTSSEPCPCYGPPMSPVPPNTINETSHLLVPPTTPLFQTHSLPFTRRSCVDNYPMNAFRSLGQLPIPPDYSDYLYLTKEGISSFTFDERGVLQRSKSDIIPSRVVKMPVDNNFEKSQPLAPMPDIYLQETPPTLSPPAISPRLCPAIAPPIPRSRLSHHAHSSSPLLSCQRPPGRPVPLPPPLSPRCRLGPISPPSSPPPVSPYPFSPICRLGPISPPSSPPPVSPYPFSPICRLGPINPPSSPPPVSPYPLSPMFRPGPISPPFSSPPVKPYPLSPISRLGPISPPSSPPPFTPHRMS